MNARHSSLLALRRQSLSATGEGNQAAALVKFN
jgi:hypothetical protein